MVGDAAVRVDDVSKRFRLYQDRPQSLKQRLVQRQRSRYEIFWALRDVSLSVEKGETYGVVGHNGSGKSTLLRLIAGIHRPTSGRIRTTGRIAALLELGAGFHPELTGRENIYLNGSILGLTRKDIARAFSAIVDFSGLEQFIDTPVKLYSSGMHVRLGFSVAVHLDPELLLIDEIIAVGDEEFQRRCLDHIYKLRREGTTIVIVSHSLPIMETLCDRIAWLDHGRLLAEGPPAKVIESYVHQVNVSEHERLSKEGSTSSEPSAASRRGSREAEIVGVEFVDGSGRATLTARTGEPLAVRVRFVAHAPISNPVFGIAFHHESGAHIAGPNTHLSGMATGMIAGPGHIDYQLDRLVLLPGSYYVSASIYDEAVLHAFDFHDRAFRLRVQTGATTERYGLVDLAGRWQPPRAEGGEELVG